MMQRLGFRRLISLRIPQHDRRAKGNISSSFIEGHSQRLERYATTRCQSGLGAVTGEVQVTLVHTLKSSTAEDLKYGPLKANAIAAEVLKKLDTERDTISACVDDV